MALDPEIARALAAVQDGGWLPITGGTPERARERYRELSLLRRGDGYVPEPVKEVHDATFAGPAGPVGARVYDPSGAIAATVVFLHGGGWVIGDLDTHDPMCRRLANATRAVVASIDYRLAPESPHPGPLEDCLAALRWAAHTWRGHRLAVAGDSAGGGLAAGCALRARDQDGGAPPIPEIAAQLLIYPGLDPLMTQPSVTENAEGPFLTRDDIGWFIDRYLPDEAMRSDPTVNLLRAADLSGLPPAIITAAELDPLRDEDVLYARRLRAAGVETTLIVGAGLVHGYFGMVELSAQAARVADEVYAAFAALLD